MRKIVLFLSALVACAVMPFSVQAHEAKEPYAMKVEGHQPLLGEDETSCYERKCPKGLEPTLVEQEWGPPKCECKYWQSEKE